MFVYINHTIIFLEERFDVEPREPGLSYVLTCVRSRNRIFWEMFKEFQQFFLRATCLFLFDRHKFLIKNSFLGSLTKHQTEERNIGTEEVEVNKTRSFKENE